MHFCSLTLCPSFVMSFEQRLKALPHIGLPNDIKYYQHINYSHDR